MHREAFVLLLDHEGALYSLGGDSLDFREEIGVHSYALAKVLPVEAIQLADLHRDGTGDPSLILN